MFKNENGFSLVELAIAAGLAVALAATAVTILSGTTATLSSNANGAAGTSTTYNSDVLANASGAAASGSQTPQAPAATPAFSVTAYTFANPSFIGSAADGASSPAAASSSWSASTPVLATYMLQGAPYTYGFVSVADANATIDKYAGGGKGAIAYTVSGDNTVVHDLSATMGAGTVWEYRYFSADPTVGAANILVLR